LGLWTGFSNREEIESKNNRVVIHFFSNILDIKEIDLKDIAVKIDNSVLNDNYIVSVGPLNYGNLRIDSFYNYFDVPIIYQKEISQFGPKLNWTYKSKVYKLCSKEKGNLIPIEYYPSVQFQAAYRLDCIKEQIGNQSSQNAISKDFQKLMNFEVSAPFDIGANVYDDVNPILAVLNNIITRGLPTKASPKIETIFKDVFDFSNYSSNYGEFSFTCKKNVEYFKTISWINKNFNAYERLNDSEVDIEHLQLIYSPIAIARIQKVIIEALITEKLDIYKPKWKILVEENDVPCSAIAFADLAEMFNNLTSLSEDFQNLIFPEIDLNIVSNEIFINSELHLNNNVSLEAFVTNQKINYDLVIDIAMFEISNIGKDSFSKYKCLNNCYFNIRSTLKNDISRNIYTSDTIKYRKLLETSEQQYIEIPETRSKIKYFLNLIFRKEDFRPGQLPILNRALQNKSVIGLLPTGGGKSLTYQLAAILQPGITLIVDPLRSLMKDQYDGLINSGIDCCGYINSTLSKKEKDEVADKMEQSKLLFVFISPERLAIYKFRERLKNMHELNVYFSYGVIDEVHCVSEWGHDFRFSYLHLGRNLYNYVRAKKGEVSLFGLTATASFDVLADVERELSGNGAFPLDSETIVRSENSNRLELQFKIEKVNVEFEDEIEALKKSRYAMPYKIANIENKYKSLLDNRLPIPVKISDKWGFFDAKKDFLKKYIKVIPNYINEIQSINSIQNIKNAFRERQGNDEGIENELETNIPNNFYSKNNEYEQAGIVFCPHKSGTGISVVENKESLVDLIPDVGTFSGGEDKSNDSMRNLELFRTNKQPLMIATKAFGMGIDKPNVRFTVNLNYSSSLESFVQEAGRAGRDRKIALSVIFLSDYKLKRISKKYRNNNFPLGLLKGRWFKPDDLQRIMKHYNLNIENEFIDYLTPENDLVRLFCKEGKRARYFGFNTCNDTSCRLFNKCQLRKVPKEAENWIYKDDLLDILNSRKLNIDKKYFEYQNADYETVMYFYNNSFKGELIEKLSMFQILSAMDVDVFFGDDTEIKFNEISTVKGFLTTLLKAEVNQEVVSFIKYKTQNAINGIYVDETDIAKAIYRMTCIGLIKDFTQDYNAKQYRIVSKRKKEGDYYKGLERFLLRYYSIDRAKEEINKVYEVELKKEVESELEKKKKSN